MSPIRGRGSSVFIDVRSVEDPREVDAHIVYLNGHKIGVAMFNGAGQWYVENRHGEISSAGHPSIHSAMLDLARHYLTEEPAQ